MDLIARHLKHQAKKVLFAGLALVTVGLFAGFVFLRIWVLTKISGVTSWGSLWTVLFWVVAVTVFVVGPFSLYDAWKLWLETRPHRPTPKENAAPTVTEWWRDLLPSQPPSLS